MMIIKDIEFNLIDCSHYWRQACSELIERDRILKKIIPHLNVQYQVEPMSAFLMLARAIIYRQVSEASAKKMWKRIEAALPQFDAKTVQAYGYEKLIALGLLKRKTEYLLDLSNYFTLETSSIQRWSKMEDGEIISELTKIKGISRGIAEEFLICHLSRPDVLPLDSQALLQAVSINYFSGEPVTRSEVREIAINWRPWRSVATWYMWQSVEMTN